MKRFAMVAALATAHWTGAVDSTSGQEVESAIATITVTNLTKGQILTPAVVITHSEEAPPLFVPGEPASAELAALAELGSTNGLTNKFSAEEGVLDVTTLSEFIHPTRTATVNVKFDANHWLISSASMLEMTNDGFVSLLRAEVPCTGSNTYFVGGWDAGSEANTELCSQIPAPCPVPVRSGSCTVGSAEGAVHVHSGIHGCGGFPAEIYDWGYPVAMISIQPAPDLSPSGALAAACDNRSVQGSGSNDGDSPDAG